LAQVQLQAADGLLAPWGFLLTPQDILVC
jgi:hypothetical protein